MKEGRKGAKSAEKIVNMTYLYNFVRLYQNSKKLRGSTGVRI